MLLCGSVSNTTLVYQLYQSTEASPNFWAISLPSSPSQNLYNLLGGPKVVSYEHVELCGGYESELWVTDAAPGGRNNTKLESCLDHFLTM